VHLFEQGIEVAINPLDSKIVLFLKGGFGPEDL
jgi:hypothetical protein